MTTQSFDELTSLAKQLNEESSDLNATIMQINQKLAAMNLGMESWFGPWEDEPFQIGFAKVEDGKAATWELATRPCTPILKTDDFGIEDWEAEPGSSGQAESLLRASRNIRVDGLSLLPQILSDLERAAKNKIDTIRNAKKIAADLAAKS
jgi:hypothetical protein